MRKSAQLTAGMLAGILFLFCMPLQVLAQTPLPSAKDRAFAYTDTWDDSVSYQRDWVMIARAQDGRAVDPDYAAKLSDYVTRKYATAQKLSSVKATEWHRILMTVAACGENPQAFAADVNGAPIHLVADGIYNRARTQSIGRQGLTGWIWALIALDSGDYPLPPDAATSREEIKREILAAQLSDGGFALSGSQADVDVTASVIVALAPDYARGEATARQVVDACLGRLSEMQLASGGFASYGTENVESTAQVILALTSLGIRPDADARFVKNGHSLSEVLLSYQCANGAFSHTYPPQPNEIATTQALLALVAMDRLTQGKGRIFALDTPVSAPVTPPVQTDVAAAVEPAQTTPPTVAESPQGINTALSVQTQEGESSEAITSAKRTSTSRFSRSSAQTRETTTVTFTGEPTTQPPQSGWKIGGALLGLVLCGGGLGWIRMQKRKKTDHET